MSAINYSDKPWTNGAAPPLNGANVKIMDAGIEAACDRIDALGLDENVDEKTTAVGGDELIIKDSEASGKIKKATLTNILSYLGTLIAALTGKTTPVDADSIIVSDSEATPTGISKKLTMANLWLWVRSKISALSAKTTPVDADSIVITDSEDSTIPKRMTWANAKAAIWAAWGALINAGTGKTTPVDADALSLMDSAASNATKKVTLANIFAYISGKFYAWIAALTEKATPVDADSFHYADSVGAASKRVTWANLKSVLATAFKHGGSNEVATATPGANVIPKAGADSKLAAGFVPQATTSAVGGAEFATAAEIVTGTDTDRSVNVKQLRDSADLAGMWLTKRTKMPDLTATYSEDAWSATTGWSTSNSTLSKDLTPGSLRVTATAAGYGTYKGTAYAAKTVIMRIKSSVARTTALKDDSVTLASFTVGTQPTIISCVMRGSSTLLEIAQSGATVGDYFEIDWVWIGDLDATTKQLYTVGTLSEEAARIADQLGDSAGVGVAASGKITSNLTNVSNADTVTVAGKVYTFKTALTPTEGEVLIGADYQASLVNLARAINHTGTPDTDYKCAAAHPLVSAANTSAAVTTLTALTTGELGNSITLAKSAATLTLSGSTLTGGYSDAAAKIITAVGNNIAGSGTRPAAAKIDLTNTALIGYEKATDVASGGTVTLPAGGTWIWFVYGHGATISSAKQGTSAGGATLTVAGANATVWQRRTA